MLAGHPEALRLERLAEWFLRAIDFQIAVWPIQDVYVGHGAVLEFDDNVNVLVAGRVTLEPDASVVAHGRFQIDCVILQQN